MTEFLVVFLITAVLLSVIACVLHFCRPPVYQVSREDALEMIRLLLKGELSELKWLIFIGHNIALDPELNEIRLLCAQIELEAEKGERIKFSSSLKRYDEEGLQQIQTVRVKLEKLIETSPVYREF